jgi:hypothetical protein
MLLLSLASYATLRRVAGARITIGSVADLDAAEP